MADAGFGEPGSGTVESGVFFPTAGYVTDPQLSTHNLQRAAEAKGGRFPVQQQGGRNPEGRGPGKGGCSWKTGTSCMPRWLVNVAGPASAKINAMAGALDDMTITTRALRQEVVHVPSPKEFDFFNTAPVISDSDISCYCRPEHGNHILVGSEDPECDPREWVDDEDYNREFTEQWTHQAYRYAQRVPSLEIPGKTKGVVDLYDVTDDWIPIYDKSRVPGYYMAIGTSGNQYKNAPIAGKMMASLIDYCENGNDHDIAPLQFHLPYIDRSMDVGFYSRRRPINKESSFSVLG